MAQKKRGPDKELLDLIEWFQKLKEPIPQGLELCPGSTIFDPSLFEKSLKADISTLPDGPRILSGALKMDLENLRFALGRRSRE